MIEKRYYNATTLREALAQYENEYGMSSAEFFEAHRADAEIVAPIPGFQRSVWAGLWQERDAFDALSSARSLTGDAHHTFQLA
jgi:hypothetical protein